MAEYFPLAPIQNDSPYIPEDKPEGYTNDIILSHNVRQRIAITHKQKIKQFFLDKGLSAEYEFLRGFWLTRFMFQNVKAVVVAGRVASKLFKGGNREK